MQNDWEKATVYSAVVAIEVHHAMLYTQRD
jgi:hypothetical protein